MSQPQVISKDSIHRLVRDIKLINKSPLHDQGIFYSHDDENILKGYAMIIGPSETPYENGMYFFELDFPCDYPHCPPKLTYLTNDGVTRFNPNLYRGAGKVCLSILNTWRGEQWTSCQSISTILLTLISIFNNNPLLNEPGVGVNHNDVQNYNKIISFKNLEISILSFIKRLNENKLLATEKRFTDICKKHIISNHKNMLTNAKNIRNNIDEENVSTGLYSMKFTLDYNNLYTKIKNINLKKLK